MLLRPLTFCCGGLFCLLFVYFGRVYISDLNYDTLSKEWSSPETNTSSEASSFVANETLIEAPTVKYSVEDLVANSTLGVNQVYHKPCRNRTYHYLSVWKDSGNQSPIKIRPPRSFNIRRSTYRCAA